MQDVINLVMAICWYVWRTKFRWLFFYDETTTWFAPRKLITWYLNIFSM